MGIIVVLVLFYDEARRIMRAECVNDLRQHVEQDDTEHDEGCEGSIPRRILRHSPVHEARVRLGELVEAL